MIYNTVLLVADFLSCMSIYSEVHSFLKLFAKKLVSFEF